MLLQVVHHLLADGETRPLDPGHRVVYDIQRNHAEYSDATLTLSGPLSALAFELVCESSSRALLASALDLPPRREWLLRCDRVDFPPGGVAYLHTHQGPGIRVLLHGAIRIQTAGSSRLYRPLEAWFEPGPEPVFAAAADGEPSAFVRLMVLPARLRGKSSISYVREEDQAKPKSQRYMVFVDHIIGEL